MDLVLVQGDVYPYTPMPRVSTCSPDATVNVESRPGIQLIATCRQVYQEGHALFYSSNTFHLPLAMTFAWSDGLQSENKAMIKRISITFGLDELDALLIGQIERSVPMGVWIDDAELLGKAVLDTLSSGWKSKVRHVAAWTSLEQIELCTFGKTLMLQHHDVIANLKDIDQWNQSLYWSSVLRRSKIGVLGNTLALARELGRKEALERLCVRNSDEWAGGSWMGGQLF